MTPAAAEALAVQALAHVASDEDMLGRFLALTGIGPEDLRERAAAPELLAAVLDFLLADEPLLLRFCEAADVKPALPLRARAELPGFSEPM